MSIASVTTSPLNFNSSRSNPVRMRGESDAERVGWLLQIQNNVYIDLVREHHADKRDVEREQADLRAALNESTVFWIKNLADGEPSPAERASRNEERELLDRGLELLPPRECEAMTLQLKEHLSMAEIAERLGTTKGTVARLIRSGSSRLAGLIEQLQRRPAGPEEGCADA